ncbi:MAG TPA: YggS family pyridoxal phosphate-dependent enzyme [Phycisphaerales bacterium]
MARSKSTQSSAKGGARTASKASKSKVDSKSATKSVSKPAAKLGAKSGRPAVVVKVTKIPSKAASAAAGKAPSKKPAFKPRPAARVADSLEPLDDLDLELDSSVEAETDENTPELAASATAPSRIASLSNPMPASRAALRREPAAVTPIAPMMSTPRALPETLIERYELVKTRIAAAAKRSGRRAEDILLVAVTKYATPEQVRELLGLGHRDLGENRVQHLLQQAAMVEEYQARLKTLPATRKAAADAAATLFDAVPGKPGIPDPAATSARWHMIGHLQRNKAKKIIELVRLTHSVDSLRVAEELQTLALKKDRVIDVLIQVNCSGEDQKFGCPIPATIPLAEQIGSMINVRVRGLMTMAAYSDNPEDARHTFARCRELFEELRASGAVEGPVNILSMGMTGDFEVAIEEGANCIRIGSAIFGEPPASSEEAENDEE